MKTITTIRRTAAMMVIFFAVTTTSCQKENEITPDNGGSAPVAPPVVAVPSVSVKPQSITTTENGAVVRTQVYQYDAQGKLIKYLSAGATSDSVFITANSVVFKRPGSNAASQVLSFNADKTFKALFSSTDQIDFENNQTKLSRMTKARVNNTPLTVGVLNYNNNNLSVFGAEVRIDINYHDNLPYQKGINEIPVAFKPIQFYKVMEQENATATVLYGKLIRQVIIGFSSSTVETHQFDYTFDGNNRVTRITDTITNTTAGSSVQKIQISTISY